MAGETERHGGSWKGQEEHYKGGKMNQEPFEKIWDGVFLLSAQFCVYENGRVSQ